MRTGFENRKQVDFKREKELVYTGALSIFGI